MEARLVKRVAVALVLLLQVSLTLHAMPLYPWPRGQACGGSLEERIHPPYGYERIPAAECSFASWLRGLPLRPAGAKVHLFDGREKGVQDGGVAIVDIDVGPKDLQQCADAVIRLRAEYLLARGCANRIAFHFSSGHLARWSDWRTGRRPVVSGNKVSWRLQDRADSTRRSFRGHLDSLFTYAGSYSLTRELESVTDPSRVQPVDVFIQGGFPGHAVLVVDVAEDQQGKRIFLLVQSFMPAQDIHVLTNPAGPHPPWYPALRQGILRTPEWTFSYSDLRRFSETDCNTHEKELVPREKAIE